MAFVILVPGVAAGLVPWRITHYRLHDWSAWGWIVKPVAVVLYSIWRFAAEGRGTPAPIALTASLVVGIVAYLVSVAAGFVLFPRLYEEPTLLKTYGDSYARYRAAVPGWWPRRIPWKGAASNG